MTSLVVSLALLVQPFAGVTSPPAVAPVGGVAAVHRPDRPPPPRIVVWTDSELSLTYEGPAPTTTLLEPPPPEPPPVLSAIDAAIGRLAELGATPWQQSVFRCLAWFESRHNPYAVSATNDHGIFQINRFFHAWRWRGRDIYDPVVNAEVAFDIYRESGFRAWTTARYCGV